ncbi:MAG: hypothetical protein V1733_00770 [bacterium]
MLIILIGSGIFLVLFMGLNYFGEHFVKRYLQVRIRTASHGIYEITFTRFNYNLFTGTTVITGFQLIPNEMIYDRLRKEGKAKRTLYSLTYDRMTLRNLSLREIFLTRTIHLREIELDKPVINFEAYPDSVDVEKGKFKRLYQDIYPVMSSLFSEVKIDSVIVNNGSVFAKRRAESGRSNEGEWIFSAILRDFDLSTYNYFDEGRVFYSKDVELRIKNFSYSLADSLYFLTADEVGFSLLGSRIFGKGLTLTPNFNSRKLAETHAGNLYQAYLPEFSIDGADLFDAMLKKKVTLSSLEIANLVLRVFKHDKPGEVSPQSPKRRINLANLYTVFSGKLKNITLDTFILRDASFYYFSSVTSSNQEVSIRKLTLQLHGFQLDSLAHLDTTKIFYARDIELQMTDFSLALQDKLHDLNAYRVNISTRKHRIEVFNATLVPSHEYNPAFSYKSNSFYHILFPEIRIDQINLPRMFNSKDLEFETLTILEPDLEIIQYRSKNIHPNPKTNQETFLEKLDLARNLVLPYMKSIRAGTIGIQNARISFQDAKDGHKKERISGLLDLVLTRVNIDTSTYRDRKAFVTGLDLELTVRDFRYVSPDSLHRVSIGELFANSTSSLLDVTDFSFFATPRNPYGTTTPSYLDAQFKSLQVNGFNHRKWLDGRTFSAQQIRLEDPRIVLRSQKKRKGSSLNEPFAGFQEEVKKIEIGNIKITQCWFDYAEEDIHGKSSLTARNFDFQLAGFLFDLTGWNEKRKVLRYDFLTLHLDPEFPLILDSNYSISFTRFLSDSYPPDISVKDLQVDQIGQKPDNDESREKFNLSLPSFRIFGFDLGKTLFDRDLKIREIEMMDPVVTLVRHAGIHPQKTAGNRHPAGRPEIKSPFHSIGISNLKLSNGTLHYISREDEGTTQVTVDRITTTIREFHYDSTQLNKDTSSLFYCYDITLQTGGYRWLMKDSLYTLSIAGLRLSTANSDLSLDSLNLAPRYSDSLFSRKLGYQTDRLDLLIRQIDLQRLDFAKLLEENRIEAGYGSVEGLILDDYRDKRIPFPTWQKPPMPPQLIEKIRLPVSIDSVWLRDARITYREQTGTEPGTIFFDRMNLLIRNFTNDSVRIANGPTLEASGSAWLMGKGLLEGSFRFPLNSPSDTFFFAGRAGQVSLEILNPLLSNLTPIRIKSGISDSVRVNILTGNSTYSTGTLDYYYHDLKLQMLHRKKGFLNYLETEVYQLLLDLSIPEDNTGYFGKHRTGYIWFQRDIEKGYFNFFWKSIYSGLKSSEGLNSKEQRALKKALNK